MDSEGEERDVVLAAELYALQELVAQVGAGKLGQMGTVAADAGGTVGQAAVMGLDEAVGGEQRCGQDRKGMGAAGRVPVTSGSSRSIPSSSRPLFRSVIGSGHSTANALVTVK